MIVSWIGLEQSSEQIIQSVILQQESAVASMLESCGKKVVSGFGYSPHSYDSTHVASAAGATAKYQGRRSV